jgi:hypothetical protein
MNARAARYSSGVTRPSPSASARVRNWAAAAWPSLADSRMSWSRSKNYRAQFISTQSLSSNCRAARAAPRLAGVG